MGQLASVVAEEVGEPAAAVPTEKPGAPSTEDIQAEMLEIDASDAEAPEEDKQQEQEEDKESDTDSDEEDLGIPSEDWTLDFLAALDPDDVISGTTTPVTDLCNDSASNQG